ncbi:MAG: PDZ domain-containing protein [Flavobacteriales bacterium]|nr:PDZ domain-containing protein [Flavobacteriales bacterium]
MTDVFILKNTNNEKSLNDVMKILYQDYAKQGKGISDTDYKNVIEQVSETSYNEIYENFLHGTTDYTSQLKESLIYIGCELKIKPSKKYNEAFLGFTVRYENNKCIIDNIYPNSIAEENGISINDELIAINGVKITHNLTEWSEYFKTDEIALSVKRELGVIEKIKLKATGTVYFKAYTIDKKETSSNFKAWSR